MFGRSRRGRGLARLDLHGRDGFLCQAIDKGHGILDRVLFVNRRNRQIFGNIVERLVPTLEGIPLMLGRSRRSCGFAGFDGADGDGFAGQAVYEGDEERSRFDVLTGHGDALILRSSGVQAKLEVLVFLGRRGGELHLVAVFAGDGDGQVAAVLAFELDVHLAGLALDPVVVPAVELDEALVAVAAAAVKLQRDAEHLDIGGGFIVRCDVQLGGKVLLIRQQALPDAVVAGRFVVNSRDVRRIRRRPAGEILRLVRVPAEFVRAFSLNRFLRSFAAGGHIGEKCAAARVEDTEVDIFICRIDRRFGVDYRSGIARALQRDCQVAAAGTGNGDLRDLVLGIEPIPALPVEDLVAVAMLGVQLDVHTHDLDLGTQVLHLHGHLHREVVRILNDFFPDALAVHAVVLDVQGFALRRDLPVLEIVVVRAPAKVRGRLGLVKDGVIVVKETGFNSIQRLLRCAPCGNDVLYRSAGVDLGLFRLDGRQDDLPLLGGIARCVLIAVQVLAGGSLVLHQSQRASLEHQMVNAHKMGSGSIILAGNDDLQQMLAGSEIHLAQFQRLYAQGDKVSIHRAELGIIKINIILAIVSGYGIGKLSGISAGIGNIQCDDHFVADLFCSPEEIAAAAPDVGIQALTEGCLAGGIALDPVRHIRALIEEVVHQVNFQFFFVGGGQHFVNGSLGGSQRSFHLVGGSGGDGHHALSHCHSDMRLLQLVRICQRRLCIGPQRCIGFPLLKGQGGALHFFRLGRVGRQEVDIAQAKPVTVGKFVLSNRLEYQLVLTGSQMDALLRIGLHFYHRGIAFNTGGDKGIVNIDLKLAVITCAGVTEGHGVVALCGNRDIERNGGALARPAQLRIVIPDIRGDPAQLLRFQIGADAVVRIITGIQVIISAVECADLCLRGKFQIVNADERTGGGGILLLADEGNRLLSGGERNVVIPGDLSENAADTEAIQILCHLHAIDKNIIFAEVYCQSAAQF